MKLAAMVVMAVAFVICVLFPAAQCSKSCSTPEDYRIADGRDYRGTRSVTRQGYTCQNWLSEEPHPHSVNYDAGSGVGDHNYCRNPFFGSGVSMVGCYTTSPEVTYDYCDVGAPCVPLPTAKQPSIFPKTTNLIAGESEVTIVPEDEDAVVRYTEDSSFPTASSQQYLGPIKPTQPGLFVVSAVAFATGMDSSDVSVRSYLVLGSRLPSPVMQPLPGTWSSPVLVSISVQANCTLLYTLDGRFPSASVAVPYTDPFWIKERSILRVICVAPGRAPSLETSGTFDVQCERYVPPTLLPANGSYLQGVDILVTPSPPQARHQVSFNDSAFSDVDSPLIRLEAAGCTKVTVKTTGASLSDSAFSTGNFCVERLPRCVLSLPSGRYTEQVLVTIQSSLKMLAQLYVNDTRTNESSLLLSVKGQHNVTCILCNAFGCGPVTSSLYELASYQLAPPQPGWLRDNIQTYISPFSFNFDAPKNGRVEVLRNNSWTPLTSDIVADTKDTATTYTVAVRSLSNSTVAFAEPSLPATFSFRLLPRGELSTPYVMINESCVSQQRIEESVQLDQSHLRFRRLFEMLLLNVEGLSEEGTRVSFQRLLIMGSQNEGCVSYEATMNAGCYISASCPSSTAKCQKTPFIKGIDSYPALCDVSSSCLNITTPTSECNASVAVFDLTPAGWPFNFVEGLKIELPVYRKHPFTVTLIGRNLPQQATIKLVPAEMPCTTLEMEYHADSGVTEPIAVLSTGEYALCVSHQRFPFYAVSTGSDTGTLTVGTPSVEPLEMLPKSSHFSQELLLVFLGHIAGKQLYYSVNGQPWRKTSNGSSLVLPSRQNYIVSLAACAAGSDCDSTGDILKRSFIWSQDSCSFDLSEVAYRYRAVDDQTIDLQLITKNPAPQCFFGEVCVGVELCSCPEKNRMPLDPTLSTRTFVDAPLSRDNLTVSLFVDGLCTSILPENRAVTTFELGQGRCPENLCEDSKCTAVRFDHALQFSCYSSERENHQGPKNAEASEGATVKETAIFVVITAVVLFVIVAAGTVAFSRKDKS